MLRLRHPLTAQRTRRIYRTKIAPWARFVTNSVSPVMNVAMGHAIHYPAGMNDAIVRYFRMHDSGVSTSTT
jgi:hypothetical protein